MTPMILGDAELLELIATGDEIAFTALYRTHQGPVYRFALLMSGSANVADEVVQEVFLMLIREPNRFDPARGALRSYLYGVARNHVFRFLKREQPYVSLVEETDDVAPVVQFVAQDDPLGNCTRDELIKLVRQAVLSLPAHYREVVVLCDFQELNDAEAAVALDCPIGTVNSRLHRGHALLLKKLCAVRDSDSATTGAQPMRCFV